MATQPHNYISSFESLKQWFDAQGCVKFNLYRGFHDRMPERAIVHKQRSEQVSMEDSWETLQSMILMNGTGGGKFTIFVPSFGAAKGVSVFYGHELSPLGLAPGIAGYSAGRPAVGMLSENEVERRINDALERERLHRKVTDLESALDQKQTWQDVLFEKVLQIDPDKALATLGNLLSIPPAAQTPVQVRGIHQEDPPDDQAVTPEEVTTAYTYDGDRMMPALDAMCAHFTTPDEFVDFIVIVAEKFCSNPTLYRSLIGK